MHAGAKNTKLNLKPKAGQNSCAVAEHQNFRRIANFLTSPQYEINIENKISLSLFRIHSNSRNKMLLSIKQSQIYIERNFLTYSSKTTQILLNLVSSYTKFHA